MREGSAATSRRSGRAWIGTSGWMYRDWKGVFYPPDLPARKHLEFYSEHFDTVEVNASFYHLPMHSTFAAWAERTPPGFLFTVKLSRFITHIKRLKDVREPVKTFLERARLLGPKLGPVLVQLPPRFRADEKRLDRFLTGTHAVAARLGLSPLRIAMEFRDPTWYAAPILSVLEKHGAALVLAHSSRYEYPRDEPITTDWTYLRFHGPEGMFSSPYGKEALRSWARKMRKWMREGMDVYAYFNNDVQGHAVRDASALVGLVAGREPWREHVRERSAS